jgi:hypothetical protein
MLKTINRMVSKSLLRDIKKRIKAGEPHLEFAERYFQYKVFKLSKKPK